ncbi:hypothetical protein BKI52_02675 [marine bacterium AO1-C]|nr:hypothetical protein BKI52_02675 [marine bacterium AO1-C]
MNYLLTDLGEGWPLKSDDIAFLQSGMYEGFAAVTFALTNGVIAARLSGTLTENAVEYSFGGGYVVWDAEIFWVRPSSGSIQPGTTPYIRKVAELKDKKARLFADKEYRKIQQERTCVIEYLTTPTTEHIAYKSLPSYKSTAELDSDFMLISPRVDTLELDLSTAALDIERNTQDIAAAALDIERNTQDSNALAVDVERNTQDIAAAALDIERNTQDTNTLAVDVERNTQDIAAATLDIEELFRSMPPVGAGVLVFAGSEDFDGQGYGVLGTKWYGWAMCFGQDVGIPDMRNLFPFGWDGNGNFMQLTGQEQVQLTIDNMPEHNHANGTYGRMLRSLDVAKGEVSATPNYSITGPGPVNIWESEVAALQGSSEPFSIIPPARRVGYAIRIL